MAYGTIRRGARGKEVKTLQRYLNLYEDGIFGTLTEEGVKNFQKQHGLEADGVVGPKTWAALEAEAKKSTAAEDTSTPAASREDSESSTASQSSSSVSQSSSSEVTKVVMSVRKITEIIIHCTATAEGRDYTVQDITKWHKSQGYSDIGYHYVVLRDGSVRWGRDINVTGAHCLGHNTNSIGIVYVGGCTSDGLTPKDTRTPAQKDSLFRLLRQLRPFYPGARIYSHHDFANKACPSFDATQEYRGL